MLRDAVAVVTGAASGIGRALAERFVAEGARRVVVADLDGTGAVAVAAAINASAASNVSAASNAAAAINASAAADHADARPTVRKSDAGRSTNDDMPKIGGEVAVAVPLDVADEAAVRDLAVKLERDEGRVDIWCSNAGVAAGAGLGDDTAWELSWRVNVQAHLYAARAVLPGMVARGRGHLMATASAAGLLTEVASAPYSVTKHGAVALAEWLAIRYAGTGVTFSCLCPQGVRTPMLAGVDPGSPTVAGGVLEPAQVADAVVAALAEGRFLILPHPRVAEYERRRTADRERWLAGMARAVRRDA